MNWIQTACLWMVAGILYAKYVSPQINRFFRRRYSPDRGESLREVRETLVNVTCGGECGCGNTFLVKHGTIEFSPNYCCYCGCRIVFSDEEKKAFN